MKHQKFLLPQCWRLEVQNPGTSRATFPLRLGGKTLCQPLVGAVHPWRALAHHRITCLCLGHDMCVCVSVFTSSYKDIHHVGLGPTLMTSASLSHLCRHPASIHRDHELGLHTFFFFFNSISSFLFQLSSKLQNCSSTKMSQILLAQNNKLLTHTHTHTHTQTNIIFVLTI